MYDVVAVPVCASPQPLLSYALVMACMYTALLLACSIVIMVAENVGAICLGTRSGAGIRCFVTILCSVWFGQRSCDEKVHSFVLFRVCACVLVLVCV